MARVCIPLLLLATFILGCLAAAKEDLDCRSLLNEFNDHFNRQQLQSPYNAQDLLFVLRTPQTYAEQLESCLIRPGVVGTKRCPTFTEEQITSNIAKRLKGCNVLSSPDDLSVIDSLDAKIAVAAQLRDPVERIVSAYEVAVEVAAQKLQAATAKNPFEAMSKQHHYEKVFPWSKLGAFLAKDMQKRGEDLDDDIDIMSSGDWAEIFNDDGSSFFMHTITDEQKDTLTEEEKQHLLPAVDPYNNKVVMPLKDFVKNARAMSLLHNGALLQILGLTNTSSWAKAQSMRTCIRRDADVADELYNAAVKRLESFAFVGLADDLHSSVELAAATLERPLSGPAYVPGELFIAGVKKVKLLSFTGGMKPEQASSPAKEVEIEMNEAMTLEELKEAVKEKEEEAQKLYDVAYDLFVKKTGTKAEIAAARAKVSEAKAAVLQLKHDLELMEGQKLLDKTVEGTTLGAAYQTCAKKIQDAHQKVTQKALSNLVMPDGRQVRFTPEARKSIPEDTLAEIRRLNALDIKLYEHAKQLVQKRRQALEAAGKLEVLPALIVPAVATDAAVKTEEL